VRLSRTEHLRGVVIASNEDGAPGNVPDTQEGDNGKNSERDYHFHTRKLMRSAGVNGTSRASISGSQAGPCSVYGDRNAWLHPFENSAPVHSRNAGRDAADRARHHVAAAEQALATEREDEILRLTIERADQLSALLLQAVKDIEAHKPRKQTNRNLWSPDRAMADAIHRLDLTRI
jgi:hypothetical protein